MELYTFTTVKELYTYIEANNIQNIDIRFLDSNFKLRSFCINANILSSKIFTSSSFSFSSYALLPLKLKRAFKDPFLPNPTLIFFTNLLEHSNIIQSLQNQQVTSHFIVSFYIDISNSNFKSYNLCVPPFDHNRTIRDEIALVANKSKITIRNHFCKDNGCNILVMESKNKLELLDNIEKIKYIILMVSSIFNQTVNLSKGIFSQPSILNN